MKKHIYMITIAAALLVIGCDRFDVPEVTPDPDRPDITRIYGSDRYCAFPTLARHNGMFWCAFREGISHAGAGGVIKVLRSQDGDSWEEFQTIRLESDAPTEPPAEDEVSFNGVNQYMMIPHDEVFDFKSNESFSVTAWVKTENEDYSMLVSTRNGGDGYDFGHQSNWLFTDMGTPYIRVQTGAAYSSNEWHHVAFCYNGSDKTLDIYVDGEVSCNPGAEGSSIWPGRQFTTQANTYGNNIFVFAQASNRQETSGGRYTKGVLRDLRFWNKALDKNAIARDMTSEVTAYTEGLVAAYDFAAKTEDGKDIVIADIMGQNPGYLKNMSGDDEATADLRDPRLLPTPDGGLMMIADGEKYDGTRIISRRPYVTYLGEDGRFGELEESVICYPDDKASTSNFWIWSPKFNGSTLYGFDYIGKFVLLKSEDCGRTFTTVKKFESAFFGNPSEADMAFDKDGKMHAFIRRNGTGSLLENSKAFYGTSAAPYTEWSFIELDYRLEGEYVMFKDDESFLIGTRMFDEDNSNPKTAVYSTDLRGNILRKVVLQSSGDNSYPGMVVWNKNLYVVYYSSHQGVPSIYRATIPMSHFDFNLDYASASISATDWWSTGAEQDWNKMR